MNTHILMFFLDGIGLGDDDSNANPFAIAHLPTLTALANGKRWLQDIGVQQGRRSIFIPTDPRMGVEGRPQSGTGQATILSGKNIPQIIGRHYGPKPDEQTRQILSQDNIFIQIVERGQKAALLEAYPPRWHQAVASGKQLRASFQLAPHAAGLPTFGQSELYSGEAFSGDWTGEGWRTQLGYKDTPIYTPYEAGKKIVEVSRQYAFAFHSNWFTDIIGHRGTLEQGIKILETFDAVMAGVLDEWNDEEGLILITSDHGNMEDLTHGKHTENDVPTIVIGRGKEHFAEGFMTLADFVPRILQYLFGAEEI